MTIAATPAITITPPIKMRMLGRSLNNYPLTYEWQVISKPEGSAAVLSVSVRSDGSDGSQASIETDLDGDCVIQLVVTDSKGLASEPAYVVVSTDNSAPVADAGVSQVALVGDIVYTL